MDPKKPGVYLYFELLPILEQLSDEERGRLLWAMMTYAKDGTELELSANLKLIWPLIRGRVDADDSRYSEVVLQKRYAGYCSAQQRAGREPLGYSEWLERVNDR